MMRSVARRNLLSAIIAMVLMFAAAMLSARDAGLKWLAVAIFSPGLKTGAFFFSGGAHGSNSSAYLKFSIFLSLILWWVVVELIWIALVKLRTGKNEA